MADDFTYDVFLSHSSKDKAVVRAVAERLRADNLRVWFDEWELKPGDSIPAKIEAGLEHSRVLVLCMSAQAFGSDWATLESQTFRFRDPLNRERRFIPLRLDEAPIKGSLAQFLYINWLRGPRAGVCEAPRSLPAASEAAGGGSTGRARAGCRKGHPARLRVRGIHPYAFSPDGKRALRPMTNRAAVGRGDGALPARVKGHTQVGAWRGAPINAAPSPALGLDGAAVGRGNGALPARLEGHTGVFNVCERRSRRALSGG